MKYVIMRINEPQLGGPIVFPIIFPERLTHAIVADHMRKAIKEEFGAVRTVPHPVSAGTCDISYGCEFVVTHHGSVSLNIASDISLSKRDQQILNLPEAVGGRFDI